MDFVKSSSFEKFSKKRRGDGLNPKPAKREIVPYSCGSDTHALKALLYLMLSLLFLIFLPIIISILPIVLVTSMIATLFTAAATVVTFGFLSVSIRKMIFYLSQIFMFIIMFIKSGKLPIHGELFSWIYKKFLYDLNFPLYDYIYQNWTIQNEFRRI